MSPPTEGEVAGTCTTGCGCGAKNAHTPSAMTPNCGRSLSTLLNICTQPAVRAPSTLTNTNNQTSETANTAASPRFTSSPGKKTDRYPTTPVASTALVTQVEIQ